MADAIEFWFANGSPSAYLGAERVDAIGEKHNRQVVWKVFDIRAALEVEGIKPNVFYDRKGPYQIHDWRRTSRLRGIAYNPPTKPMGSVSTIAGPGFLHFEKKGGQPLAKDYAFRVMRAHFGEGLDMSDPKNAMALVKEMDPNAPDLGSDELQALFAKATEEALEKGIWGAPTTIVDGELFWGEDRLDQVDLWLERGGW